MWFFLSLCTAMAVASQDAWVKKKFSGRSTYEMAAFPLFYSLPPLLLSLIWVPRPPLDEVFWWNFGIGLPLNSAAFLLYMRAIKISPLSLTIPFVAFTPTFMIATGLLFLRETPDQWGVAGILATCAGGYVIHVDTAKWSPLSPLRAVFRETGSWLMLIVAFLFSFTAVIGKLAILHSSPLFFSMSFFAAFNFLLILWLSVHAKITWRVLLSDKKAGIVAGCLYFLHVIFHGYAISMTKAAYMISVKRLSVLISVLYGGLVFKEENIPVRLFGAALMLLGAVLILLKAE